MSGDGILVLGGPEIEELLAGREEEIVSVVERAYVAHNEGKSSLPHSIFLRFPGNELDRIIALPAYLGDGFDVAGLKWISSFPGNLKRGLARASAILILNECEGGRPQIVLESSIISARRTAASAASGARALLEGRVPERVGLIGTGLINFEIARFLGVVCGAKRFLLHDLDTARAGRFASVLRDHLGAADVGIARETGEVLASCPLVSFATTAIRPHVRDLSACPPGAVLLHISLRDLTAEAILEGDNVVDDVDHVCRAQTSIHLAEQATGGRGFVRCTLADILSGRAPARKGDGSVAIFSPFGLGVLDVAVGKLVADAALAAGRGTHIPSFFPAASGDLFT
ncbi:MAG TPA: 2,3-diaminopropionate biosynthesis protein SbnB [Thermoanaerobaculia bacterium]|nr:2,3-diaminopropionate biosynthesis protein SbnB [Thermoanaerobaculia bacterium]